MIVPIFVDTNVFIYGLDTSEPAKQARATSWLETLWDQRRGRTSYQVLHELYVNLTHKLSNPLEDAHARAVVRALMAWNPHPPDQSSLEQAWSLQDRYALSWWDSLIVASARLQGCRFLLTEDLQHNQDLAGLTVVSPFEVEPADLGEKPKR